MFYITPCTLHRLTINFPIIDNRYNLTILVCSVTSVLSVPAFSCLTSICEDTGTLKSLNFLWYYLVVHTLLIEKNIATFEPIDYHVFRFPEKKKKL